MISNFTQAIECKLWMKKKSSKLNSEHSHGWIKGEGEELGKNQSLIFGYLYSNSVP